MARTFTLTPLGAFSLHDTARIGFGPRPAEGDAVLRLAFCLDGGFDRQVAVEVRERGATVECTVHGSGDLTAIRLQTARLLSLDHDARGFIEVGRRDPVIGQLQAAAPGLRPTLFHSPYEAAAWCVLSARRPHWHAAQVRSLLSDAAGRRFELGGRRVSAFPTPRRLLRIGAFPGIDSDRLDRLHAVAQAAEDGLLEVQRLRDLGPFEACVELRGIPGIDAFAASLIVVCSLGYPDILPPDEPRVRELARELYGMDELLSPEQFALLAEVWRPWRAWATVLLRAVGPGVLGEPVGNVRERLSA
jgi:DNA-3-methyladenine glycosylase II